MHLERAAFRDMSGRHDNKPAGRAVRPHPSGPRHGVMAELRRIDPSGQRQVSTSTEARCQALGWTLEHLGITIGTVIHGPNLELQQRPDMIRAINDVLLERKVVVFQRQNLSEAGQIEFAKNWGALEVFPFAVADDDLAVDPQIHRFHVGTQGAGAAAPEAMLPPESASNVDHDATLRQMSEKRVAPGWHSDVTWRKTPSLGSMLYCDIAPPFGGATSFSDCYAALQGLTPSEREALRVRRATASSVILRCSALYIFI